MPNDTTSEQTARENLERNPFPQIPQVRVRDDAIAIVTGYSEALHRLLRWVPKARWSAAERCWLVPFSGADALRAVLPEITRLAEAAQELDAAVGPQRTEEDSSASDLLLHFVEAAGLLFGPDWRAVLAKEGKGDLIDEWLERGRAPDRAEPIVADLAARVRRKSAALARAADRLDAGLASAKDEAGSSRR